MQNTVDKLKNQLTQKLSWQEIEPKDYANYGIASFPEARVVYCYKVGTIYGAFNTLTLYDYGKDDKFIKQLNESYLELQDNKEEQEELGMKPEHWEVFDKNSAMLSIVKVLIKPEFNVVDVFFVFMKNVYCFHTYIVGDDKDLSLDNLQRKYEIIDHIVKEINGLKK
mgnify:CR=1 FL=1